MSSSTVTNPYITESWIHMEQQRFATHNDTENKEGKYTRSTASSRSRALLNKQNSEVEMSQTGIYEAFSEAEKPPTRKYNDTRRKSTTTIEVKRPPVKSIDSPRLRTLNTNNEQQQQQHSRLNTRRQTLSGALMTTKEDNHGGLVKLADTLRNTLAVERRLAKQELGIYNNKPPQSSVVDIISTAKRRSSVTKEKLRTLEQPRRRTLSSGASILSQQQQQQTTSRTPEASYMKTTKAADQQRRHSTANTTVNRINSASPRKKLSTLSKGDTSPSITTSEDESAAAAAAATKKSSALKRRSILAAATAKARQQLDLANNNNTSTTATTTATTIATTTATNTQLNSGNEESTHVTMIRTRKKSQASESSAESILANRRMSRTESLKEGLPTSPSITAARMARRKSVITNESPNKVPMDDPPPAPKKTTVRKRGKTLPGNLAKPPTVQSLQLPPMKLEPIKLSIPQQKRIAPKSPSVKAMNTTSTSRLSLKQKKRLSLSTNTTPIPVSSSSSSSTEAHSIPPKKSISTRRAKGQSHLGILTSRRASLKAPSSSQIVTPPLKKSPVNVPSPRVRPTSTRRQSLATVNSTIKQTTTNNTELNTGRKLSSSAYSSSSRKNSLVEESIVDKDKGRHRAISLREKLEAMVAQHAIHEDNTTSEYNRSRKKSQSYEDEKYAQLSLEERARPQRIKDTLMMWDKEMVEAFSPGIPKSPQIAIKFYGHHLSPFEQTEIHNYPEVYFVGHQSKKHQAMPDNSAFNYGYDDERGDYKSVTKDHLSYRYEVLEELGRGSFGQVVKCYDHKTASTVAVKLIRNKKRFYAQAKTEVKILSDLVKWDPEDRHHNVKMTDSFNFRNHLCIAFECLSMNLYEFIKINNFQGFHITLIKRFTIQLLRSLSLLARHGVVHCDLKPENILLKHPTKSTIKVIDFGSSCLENQRVYTYIQSRFYRSPEIILGLDYTMAIDMWSLGCIIAELYTGVPIFPGENEQEQLACIMEVLGVPSPELIQQSERRNLFFDRRGEPRVVCNSRGKKRRAGTKNLSQALRCNDTLFLDFIQQCLAWDPSKRLNPEAAFQHEWISQSTRPTAIRTTADEENQEANSSPKPTSNDTNYA